MQLIYTLRQMEITVQHVESGLVENRCLSNFAETLKRHAPSVGVNYMEQQLAKEQMNELQLKEVINKLVSTLTTEVDNMKFEPEQFCKYQIVAGTINANDLR